MDKLEPIIKHRFWILLCLVAPLTIYGYYSASGAMKEATTKRVGEIDGLFSKIPSGSEANPRWAQGLSGINKTYEQAVNAEIIRAWERQQARMTWPASMQKYVPPTYRDPFESQAGVVYNNLYGDLLRDLHSSIEPVTMTPQGKIVGSGKVLFDEKLIPRTSFTGRLSIPSGMIWDAQEDIWYLQLLFDAIRKMNQPSENAAKSAVRAVLKVELWGGNGESSAKGSSLGSGSGEGSFGAGMAEQGMEMETMAMAMGGGMDLLGGGRSAKVSFNPEEEFGTGGAPANGQGMMRGMGMGMMSARSMMMPEGDLAAAADGTGASTTTAETLRYVKKDDSAPFLERGFYLSVLIDQRKIAEFLVELTNSDWPIRIGRFHVGPNPQAGKGSMGSAGSYMPLAGMGAFGGEGDSGSMEEMMSMAAMASANPFEEGSGDMMMDGGIGAPTLNPTGEAVGLLQQFDLVQLDLVGYITFYKPPPADVLAAVEQAVKDAAGATAGPSGATAPSDPVTIPAAEGATDPAGASDSSAPQPAGDQSAPAPAADPSAAPADTTPDNSSGETGASEVPASAGPPTGSEASAGTP